MAFIFGDSFNHYATADITKKYTQVVIPGGTSGTANVAPVGRHGSNGLKLSPNNVNVPTPRLALTPSTPVPNGSICIVGFAFCANNNTAFASLQSPATAGEGISCPLLTILYQGNIQFWFKLNTNGTISALKGNTAGGTSTILGTGTIAASANVYTYLEFKVTLNGTSGTVDIHQDGVSSLSLSSQNTLGNTTATGGATTWDEIRWPSIYNTAGTGQYNYCDTYVLDGSGTTSNTFLGDTRIDAIFPDAPGAETGWTPLTANNWFEVSEVSIDGDTSYNSANTANTRDTYKTSTQPVTGANIFAVQVCMGARKTDAGSAGLSAIARIAGTDYLGTQLGVPSSYAFLRQIWDINPGTGVAWVDGDIGPTLAQFGVDKSL